MQIKQVVASFFAILLASNVQASVISYELSQVGAGTWQYDYTVTNNSLPSPIEEVTIYFPGSLYSNLLAIGQPANWNSFVAEPDPNLPADGLFDSATGSAAISPGSTLETFSVQFSWLGNGDPGSQLFDIVDPVSFSTLDSGSTVPRLLPPMSGLPEPGSQSLSILGMLTMLVVVGKRTDGRTHLGRRFP